jgi:hypothetical protein
MEMSEVVSVNGGTLDVNPCGSSTQTNGRLLSRRKLKVLSLFFSFNHELCRNSTAIRYWGNFCLQDRM